MNEVRFLRAISFTEGLSYLVLLFIAMPLKYLFEQPLAVRMVGMAHGVLFLLLVLALFRAHLERAWSIKRSAFIFVAALLPFGFIPIDRRLVREIAALRDAAKG